LNIEKITEDVAVNELARKLAAAFWPGALTMVLPRRADGKICDMVCAGLKTAAVRVPAHPVIRKLLATVDFPLAAPSANPSGRLSPVSAENVQKMLGGKLGFILDGGECAVGLESTIIDLSTAQPTILREGVITREQIEAVIGAVGLADSGSEIKAPGMMLKHYAPTCPVRLIADDPSLMGDKVTGERLQVRGEALLAFGSANIPSGFEVIMNLSESGNLEEAAANLFKFMHELENLGVSGIAVMGIPDIGVGKAINERLRKAAE